VDRAEAAGVGTEMFSAAAELYVPLRAPMRTRGVLVIKPGSPSLQHVPEQRRVLDTFAALIAIALERLHFVTVAQDTSLKMESERLRNSLLGALSHDLRTPLTALVGLADTLSMKLAANGSPHARDSCEIREQAERTAQLVDNLLEMAKLQSGRVTLRRDWQLLEELAGAAIRSLGAGLNAHRVIVDLPEELPLVRCDAILIERVLVNLLQNASKYTPAGTRIGIVARADEGKQQLVVRVWHEGPGLPPGQEQALFEKFARGDKESVIPGVGLGLAICRAIVEAHGGSIWAQNQPQGGAVVSFSLPLEAAPSLEVEPEA